MYLGRLDEFECFKDSLEVSYVTFTTFLENPRFVFKGVAVYVKLTWAFSGWCLLGIGQVAIFKKNLNSPDDVEVCVRMKFQKGIGPMLFKTPTQRVVFRCSEGKKSAMTFFWIDGDGRLFLEVFDCRGGVECT